VIRRVASIAVLAYAFVAPAAASAEWRPPDLHAASGSLTGVLNASATATGTAEERYAQRRERWTYRNGDRRLPVRVAVRGTDFRATVVAGDAEYDAGRSNGTRWRADANGVTHATWSDDQGDAIDRLPQSIFPFERADCALAGDSARFGAAWVVVDRPAGDKPHWFYVDKASGLIAHEVTREGKRTIVTTFTAFEVVAGMRRPSAWHISDGDTSHDLDVTVDDVSPQPLAERDVAIPQTQRLFAPSSPSPSGVVALPASFRQQRIFVEVGLGKRRASFILDTGTASIMLNRRLAEEEPSGVVLEHAGVPSMTVGPLMLSNVSTLAIPIPLDGILGYDFFLGHVVHVDYAGQRVEVMTPQAAQSAFSDPRNTVIGASFDEGIPLVRAAFGAAAGDRFALDTGSQSLYVFEPFTRRYAHEIETRWTPWWFGSGARRRASEEEEYLEGSVVMGARRVASFQLGPATFRDTTVGVELPNRRADAIDIPLDGVIGTDEMSSFEWWFDYDGGRIALRRNNR
jgi:hypothetical protein